MRYFLLLGTFFYSSFSMSFEPSQNDVQQAWILAFSEFSLTAKKGEVLTLNERMSLEIVEEAVDHQGGRCALVKNESGSLYYNCKIDGKILYKSSLN